MKDLAALVSDAAADPAADAILLAKQLGAHLTAIAISPEPSPLYFVASGSDVIEGDRRSAAASARQQLDRFSEQALRSGLEFETRHIAGPIDLAAAEAARLSRHYDLTVVAQAKSDKDGAWNRILEAVLLDSGARSSPSRNGRKSPPSSQTPSSPGMGARRRRGPLPTRFRS